MSGGLYTRDTKNVHRLPYEEKLDNTRPLNYSVYLAHEPVRADNYFVRVLDFFGEVWPVQYPPVAPTAVPKCMDTSLHSYEVDGLHEGETLFVDNVMYYDGTLPVHYGEEMRIIRQIRELRCLHAIGATGRYNDMSLRERRRTCLPY